MRHDGTPDQGGDTVITRHFQLGKRILILIRILFTFAGLLDKVQQYEQQEIDLSAMQQRVARPKYLMLDDTFVHGGCHGVLVSLLGIIILHSVHNSENIWSSLYNKTKYPTKRAEREILKRPERPEREK